MIKNEVVTEKKESLKVKLMGQKMIKSKKVD
jgi:hypothetical protein